MSIIPYTNLNTISYSICKTLSYQDWYDSLEHKSQAEVERRLMKISEDGFFGKNPHKHKLLGDKLEELKFHDQNGMRIYFVRTGKKEITLLLGGFKNGQKKDIKKAKALIC